MTRKILSSKIYLVEGRTRLPLRNNQRRPAKQDHNNPIALEEFDREHMGIAAKE